MGFGDKIGSHLGLVAGWILGLFGKLPKIGVKDLRQMEFRTSTQRIGVRFAERIRSIFRGRWLKKR
jgi:hypothetical protein